MSIRRDRDRRELASCDVTASSMRILILGRALHGLVKKQFSSLIFQDIPVFPQADIMDVIVKI